MSKSALASLTAQYTDSDNEEDRRDDSTDSDNSHASLVIIPKASSPPQTPEKPAIISITGSSWKKVYKKKKLRRLVSYIDDTVISDEDEVSDSSESSDESISEEEREREVARSTFAAAASTHKDDVASPMNVDDDTSESFLEIVTPYRSEKSDKYKHYGFTLPPEPKGKPAPELAEKIRNLYVKMDTNNMDMNRIIQERKEFRNPSIYEKLIQFCDINEFGTNYPPEIYDPLQWGAESYYEELARVQKNEMLKRQKERKETDKIEQATALARKVEEEAKKRKSKWDQPAKQTVPPALTTTVTGTKGTVISAFGSLPKKPAQ